MLSACAAFKVGFLARCVEDGLDPAAMLASAKRAGDLLEKAGSFTGLLGTALGKTMDLGRGAAGATLGYGLPAAMAAPPVLGGIAGYGLARATDIDDTDVGEVKDREVIDAYRRESEKLRRQQEARRYRQQRQAGRVFM